MIKVRTINDSVIRVPDFSPDLKKTVLGADLFEEPYCNIFISAKKKSGKTWTVFHILKKCLGKDTRLIIFCSTLYKDDAWKYITKYFEKKGVVIEGYTSLKDEQLEPETNRTIKLDNLATLLRELEEEAEAEILEAKQPQEEETPENFKLRENIELYNAIQKVNEVEEEEEREPRKRKPKYLAPEIILVLDDLSTELKSTSLIGLLKKNRHYKMKVIISSQWIHDLRPESRKQIDYFLIFKNHTKEKLEIIYRDADLSINFQTFVKLYRHATKEPYSFLYIDARKDEYRKNFTHKYSLPA